MEILPEDDFRAAVRSEVRRCTRYSYFFSVVSVDLTTSDVAEGLILSAAQAFGSDIRETDVVGRLKGSRLGVILHHAEVSHAHLIMKRIRVRLMSDPALANWRQVLGEPAFRGTAFPTTAIDADTMFRQLDFPEKWESGDDDEGPGPAPVGARI